MMRTPPIKSMKNAFDVTGYNVVVTGGNRGIGFGIASAFAESGANVFILCRNRTAGDAAAAKLSENGVRAGCCACDVADMDSVRAAAKKVFEFFDHVDVLINNAGVATTKPFLSQEGLSEWHRVIDTDLHGPANVIHEIAPAMVEAGLGGSIINVTSVGGTRVSGARTHHNAPYHAAKAALDIFTRYLAIELGDAGIRVNSVLPGPTHSDLDRDLPPDAFEMIEKELPAHRFGEPIEIGALCVYLASPAGSQVRGVNWAHDGGLMCVK